MRSIQLIISISVCCHISGSLISITEDFTGLKNDLPMKAIDDIVVKQSEIIQSLKDYSILRINFQDTYEHGVRTPFITERVSEYESEYVDIHTDVVFVGFPSSTIESVRARWFEPLTHEDQLMASIGKDSHVVVVPGDLKIRHHFHLVQISFRAADSIRGYMKNLLIRPDDEESYINAFELEEILEDLSAVIGTTHNVKVKLGKGSDDTLFILNVDLSTPSESVKYSYKNGFSKDDISSMAEDAEIGIAVDKVLEIKRANRIDLPATTTYPLFEPQKRITEYSQRENAGR